ncbi:MAG: polyphenol oxidase family protein [Myxococcota bacterium]
MKDTLLQSRVLLEAGFVHAFTTRAGGVSPPPFDSANFGYGLGDDACVAENHRRLAEAMGLARIEQAKQVHGADVLHVAELSTEEVAQREVDALIAPAGRAVAVRTADCLPLLLAGASGEVAAVHCGWRSVVAGIVPRALDALGDEEVLAAAGPHIRAPSFEVGEDVAKTLAACAPGATVVEPYPGRPGKYRADLVAIVRVQLAERGVALDDVGGDTFAEPERFHSYRRDGARSGRLLALIAGRRRRSE